MKRYQIHANYTGAFPLSYPFEFQDKAQAWFICETLNDIRATCLEWKDLKPFQIWDAELERFIN